MMPRSPDITAYNSAEEPWRLIRLARLDGRVREVMRMLTCEPSSAAGSAGEIIWSRYVEAIHDDRGTLVVSVTSFLEDSPWLVVLAAVLQRAWDGEDEDSIFFLFPGGNHAPLQAVLPAPPVAVPLQPHIPIC